MQVGSAFRGIRFGGHLGRFSRPSGAAAAAIVMTNTTVDETAAIGAAVGTLSVANSTGTPTFTLDDSASGKFALDGSVLEVNGVLTAGSYNVTVSVNGTTPDPNPRTFTITVVDTTAPTITSSSSRTIEDDETLSHALTANETVTWSIYGGADSDEFQIVAGELQFAGDAVGVIGVYSVIVRATDAHSNTANQTITITVILHVDYTPSLDFSDARNSMYSGQVV